MTRAELAMKHCNGMLHATSGAALHAWRNRSNANCAVVRGWPASKPGCINNGARASTQSAI
eukprot:5821099-Alexandrium_andersonii.AAC.1